jgi:hypothetical protein
MNWRVAVSLLELRDQVNAAWPKRAKGADGTIGDTAHSARSSDHNPNSAGVVCALDITHDPSNGVDIGWLSDALAASRDPRIKYLIANGLILDSRPGNNPWTWTPFSGPDPHVGHLHISVLTSRCDVRGPWAIGDTTEDDMDQETSITQASDVSIGAAKGGSIIRPLRWWLSAAYAHIIGLEAPVKKIGDALAVQGAQITALTASQAALAAAQVLQTTAQTALLTQIRELVTALARTPAQRSEVDVDALAAAVVARIGEGTANDIARRIGNG